MTTDKIKEQNYKVFALLSNYLNNYSDYIKEDEIKEMLEIGVSEEYAFTIILASAFGLDILDNEEDKELFNLYFSKMIKQLNLNEFYNNIYYKNIKLPTIKIGNSELKYDKYKAYEAFVCDDIVSTEEGRQLAQIGFFNREFIYPAVMEKERLWMSVTPNEIETMKEAVNRANGKVLTFGLGLGYFQYMISEKENVNSITIVEMNEEIIKLFENYILPQFSNKDKIKIIKSDAFYYAENHLENEKYDFIYTDLWHDVSDGMDMYLKMKSYEIKSPKSEFMYWIEKSILCYL